MTAVAFRRRTSHFAPLLERWRALSLERKLKCAGLVLITGLTAYVCLTVGRHIEELLAHKAAASVSTRDSFQP